MEVGLSSITPRQIGTGFIQLSAGNEHAVALRLDNTVWAWGSNGWGQVGNGLPTYTFVPKSISETSGNSTAFTAIAAGQNHSVGVKTDGTLWAWGLTRIVQLCCNNAERSTVPKLVGSGYVSAAAGSDHTLALKSDGTLWAWGWNSSGQVGDGTATDVLIPKLIGSGYSQVASASATSYALKTDGSLWAWGFNPDGRLGNGTVSNSAIPTRIGTGFTKVVAGGAHAAALGTDGSLWTWGWNGTGQLGDGSPTGNFSVLSPRQIGTGFIDIEAGQQNTAAVKADGTLWVWGAAPLGDGSTTSSNVPRLIGNGFASVSVGNAMFAAVKTDGSLWTWGYGGVFGQLGQGPSVPGGSLTPVKIGVDISRVAVSATGSHVLAIKKDGAILAWGDGSKGQLGNGKSDPLQPVQIMVPQTVVPNRISCVFDWVERTYATVFPIAGFTSGSVLDFNFRHYPLSGNYLYQTLSNDRLGVYGPVSGNALTDLGPVSNWAATAGCN
jgi:alpha-tubulin suppressor-like RCC1 family protein